MGFFLTDNVDKPEHASIHETLPLNISLTFGKTSVLRVLV